ncbi:MAG: hypothetical protein IKW49_04075 [Opitutales bacterium]|nr:hypothetical protein [Opitutales bacterium]
MEKQEGKQMPPEPAEETRGWDAESIIAELKAAYRSITRLKNTPVHRKITLEIERRLRRERD